MVMILYDFISPNIPTFCMKNSSHTSLLYIQNPITSWIQSQMENPEQREKDFETRISKMTENANSFKNNVAQARNNRNVSDPAHITIHIYFFMFIYSYRCLGSCSWWWKPTIKTRLKLSIKCISHMRRDHT